MSRGAHEEMALDALYDEIDDALTAGDFAGVDAKIAKVDVAATSATLLLGWLTITYAAAEYLPARAGLAIATTRRLCREEGEERARELLRGLVPDACIPVLDIPLAPEVTGPLSLEWAWWARTRK